MSRYPDRHSDANGQLADESLSPFALEALQADEASTSRGESYEQAPWQLENTRTTPFADEASAAWEAEDSEAEDYEDEGESFEAETPFLGESYAGEAAEE